MNKYIERLQYITHDIPHLSHIEQAQKACEAGAKWIQYRCLSKTDGALLTDINAIAEICDDWGTTLIVTDHIHLNGQADIQGFHIEDMNADFLSIRKLVGNDVTLGGSANTVENLIRLAQEGADYAGFGPYATTQTKLNTFPVLGISGYAEAMLKLKTNNIEIPVLAVGGITLKDAEAVMQTGIYGLAVSGAINFASDFEEAYQAFHDAVKA
ncbi:thiamine phosphate synthase [Pedobacter nototheniae]|uniref:thiamine phosphate synthase n=1 Tax=Pedobacter nototheniae TaxID=2488994 RepID=UPI00292D8B0E|nr:thiamine phosphate synthase [Pedobacter nototheniae]